MSGTAIVTVNVNVATASVPNNLQKRGAFISMGGTTTAVGTLTPLTQLSDLTAVLAPGKAVTSLAWSGSVVTVTTTAPHGWTNGDIIPVVIAGAVPAGYNGYFTGTVTGASTITYPLTSNPGAETTPGTIQLGDETQLTQMASTYFSAPGNPVVYVLELGEGTATEGVAALITQLGILLGTPNQIYRFLVPREWDNNAAFLALCLTYNSPNSQLYFNVTTTVANETVYSSAAYKCVFALVESPSKATTEFSSASPFGTMLRANPGAANQVPPLSYSPCYGATAYPTQGNQATLTGLLNNSVNYVGTGAQGGVTTSILFNGKMSDGNTWSFWYSADWIQIQSAQALANEVINGSATSQNPLLYNQPGINRLQNRVGQVARLGVTAGLGNGQVLLTKLAYTDFIANYNAGLYAGKIVVNAVPFSSYVASSPNDYGQGLYQGLSCVWVVQQGFVNIVFNLTATNIPTG